MGNGVTLKASTSEAPKAPSRNAVCRKFLTFCQKTFINGDERQQEAPLPRRAQRVRPALLVYFMTFLRRESVDG